jgi:hypothetical protein
MRDSLRGALCAFLLAVSAASPATAATLSGGYSVGAVNQTCNASGQGSGTINEQTAGCAEYIDSGAFQASGSGAASHDTLRASARVGFSTLDPGGFIGTNSLLGSASGGARYTDTLVIDVAGRTGEIVDLVFETAMHGALSAVADYTYVYGVADANLAVNVNGVNVRVGRDAKSFGNSVSSDFNPGRVQIELGSPFAVSAELQTRARLFRTTGSTQFYSGDVVADFFNSGGITSFTLFEAGAGGALIPDWNLSSESGQFGFYAAAVPAPGAAWLLATGLVALAAKRRARAADRTRAA